MSHGVTAEIRHKLGNCARWQCGHHQQQRYWPSLCRVTIWTSSATTLMTDHRAHVARSHCGQKAEDRKPCSVTVWTSWETTLTTDHGAHVSLNHWGQEGTVQGDKVDIISNNVKYLPQGPCRQKIGDPAGWQCGHHQQQRRRQTTGPISHKTTGDRKGQCR